jgi:hypothetical protein
LFVQRNSKPKDSRCGVAAQHESKRVEQTWHR